MGDGVDDALGAAEEADAGVGGGDGGGWKSATAEISVVAAGEGAAGSAAAAENSAGCATAKGATAGFGC